MRSYVNFKNVIFILDSNKKDAAVCKHDWVKDPTGELMHFEQQSSKPSSKFFSDDSGKIAFRGKLFDKVRTSTIPFMSQKDSRLLATIPAIGKLRDSSYEQLTTKFARISEQVQAQPEAIEAVQRSFMMVSAGMSPKNKPLATLLCLGPTGTGKTELAKALTREFFETNPQALIRLDMSQYKAEGALLRLIGSAPGYVNNEDGGQLTNALQQHPFSIVLLDELEKAHKDVQLFFLSPLDEGYVVDASGTKYDCTKTIFIATSNIGAQETLAFQDWNDPEKVEQLKTTLNQKCIVAWKNWTAIK